jgi:hypothetical protein
MTMTAALPAKSARKLRRKQIAAAAALAAGQSQRSVAQSQGISRSVLQRWLSWPEFTAEVEAFKAEVMTSVKATLQSRLAPLAVKALEETLTADPAGPPTHSEKTRAAELTLRGAGTLTPAGGASGQGAGGVTINVLTVSEDELRRVREERRAQRASSTVEVLQP